MHRLGLLDTAFVRMESARTPMHVGGLMIFRLPDDAAPGYPRSIVDRLREFPYMPAPFNCRIQWPLSRAMPPKWVEAETDVEYHIRHSALPHPGGERELGILVSRLHSNAMDLDRPPWEMHIIEGLENNRFALYLKAHHSAVDGMGAMKMVRTWLSTDPTEMRSPGEMTAAQEAKEAPDHKAMQEQSEQHDQHLRTALDRYVQNGRARVETARDLAATFYRLGQGGDNSVIRAALRTPETPFNQRVTAQRRLGTQLLELRRFQDIAERTDSTINDVVLTICGGATRRYLQEMDGLPDGSLTASVPIAIPRSDGKRGNAVSGFVCPLGTDIADPVARLHRITAITHRTKEQMLCASSAALERFGSFGMAPLMLGQLTGTLPKWPPLFNVIVSNVVASKEKLYMMGAELESLYPMSILFDGYALNLTVVGYAGKVCVGYTGCRDAIPSLQRLAVYTGEALNELEEAVDAIESVSNG